MIAEIGHALLWLAASCAGLQVAAAVWPRLRGLGTPAAVLQGWLWLWIAGCLIWLFRMTDLSVAGVAATTSLALPGGLKLAAIAVQDGGGLIVAAALAAWGGAGLALAAPARRARAAAAAGSAILTLLLLLHTAPLTRLVPAPTEGAGFPAAARARLAALSPPGSALIDAPLSLGQRTGDVRLEAVTPVAGPDSTGVVAAVRVGGTVLTPEWRETERPRAGFPVASNALTGHGWLSATIAPAGRRWRVAVKQWPR